MSNYLTDTQIQQMADAIFSTMEVTSISHARKCEIAREEASEMGVHSPNKSAILLAVKLANLGWHNATLQAKQA